MTPTNEVKRNKRSKGIFISLIVLIVILLIIIFVIVFGDGEGKSYSSAHFEDVSISSDMDQTAMTPIGISDVYDMNTPAIYITAILKNAPEATLIRTEWWYEVQMVFDVDLESTEINQTYYSSVSKPDTGWPSGNYHINLMLDGNLYQTATFSVK